MSGNIGKKFEQQFADDFAAIPGASIDRLPDIMSGYKSITGICDFICYIEPNIFYIECKAKQGNTFSLAELTQYDKMLVKVGIPGVRAGVVLWFQDHDVVCYVPISTVTKLKEDNKKSVNIKMLATSDYNIKALPSIKKRVYLTTDYTPLKNLKDEE